MTLFFLCYNDIFSQNIVYGIVSDKETKKPIDNVSIILQNNEEIVIAYTTTNNQGEYSIEIPDNNKEVTLKTSILTYRSVNFFLKEVNTSQIEINIELEIKISGLDEVYIQGEKRPISVKQDTTDYNIKKFLDGSEQVVEDILKKLPGITVEENGLVKFKGKTVTKLLLDNDNIFDANYGIGTKNISSDIIEGIEAIEDYNENQLLKGVKYSDDVALNLKLKKGRADVSGNTELGLGVDSKKHAKLNGILVSKKLKGFSSVSYNNIGENYSPYNFISNNIDISRLSELTQRTSNLVTNNGFNSILPDSRVRVNNNFFGSINTLFKLKDNLSLRINYNHFNDKLIRKESTNTIFIFDDQEININTAENFIKQPLIHAGAYKLIYKINKKELLTSNGKIDYQKINSTSSGFNNQEVFANETFSRDVFFNNKIEYTNRFKGSTVFQSSLEVSSNDLPQNVIINTDLDTARQQIDFKKNTLDINASLLSKIKKSKYGIKLGYNFDENFVDSGLNGISFNNQPISNDVYYKISKPYLTLDYNYRLVKWNFIASIENEFFNIALTDQNIDESYSNSIYTIYPSLTIQHSLSKVSNLYASYELSNQIPDALNVFSGLVLTNNRSLLNNNFSFNLFNNQSFDVGYRINDFYNLFQFNLYSNYNYSKYGYLSRLNVDQDLNFNTFIVEAVDNKNLQFGFMLEKYVHVLKSTLNLNSNYTISQYQNIINDSGLRDNTSKNLFTEFKIRTGFKGALNFENNLFFGNNFFETELGGSNEFTSFQNDFSIKYIKDRFQFVINSQYFKPDLKQDISGDLFLDTSIRLTSKNKKIEYMLKANNLLNQKRYRNINSSDLSTTSFEHNLQERFALFSIGFRF